MAAEPGAEMTAGGGRLRASHAEREQAIEVLKAAFVQGRLGKDEFDTRVARVLTSRTRAELAPVTADLPAGPAAEPAGKPARTGQAANTTARHGVRVITAATATAAAAWAGAWSGPAAFLLAWTFTITWLGIVLLTVAVMLESRRHDRADGQLPPHGTDGRTSLGY